MGEMTENPVRIFAAPKRRGYCLETEQLLPRSREEVFAFFADAFQLEAITPPWLNFKVITPAPIQLAAGALIDYRLRLHGVPIRWQSRISEWEPPYRFVDEQVRGPYRRWHHEHVLETVPGGTLCHDRVEYEVPLGRLVDTFFVRPDLRKIFQYRREKLAEIFPANSRES